MSMGLKSIIESEVGMNVKQICKINQKSHSQSWIGEPDER